MKLPDGVEDHGDMLRCAECEAPMRLRVGPFGVFYSCTRYPKCDGVHGAHQSDGRPLGKPGTALERAARRAAHAEFDMLWRGKGYMSRTAAYAWLAKVMNLGSSESHIGLFTVEQCEEVVRQCRAYVPREFRRGFSKVRRKGSGTHDSREKRLAKTQHERKTARTRKAQERHGLE